MTLVTGRVPTGHPGKQVVAVRGASCEGKNKDSFELETFKRLNGYFVGTNTMRRMSMIPRAFLRTRTFNCCGPAFLNVTFPSERSFQFW